MGLLTSLFVALGLGDQVAGALDSASGKLFEKRLSEVLADVQRSLKGYTGTVPKDHGLERAMRAAELTASLMILRQWQADWMADGVASGDVRTAPPPFAIAAERWLQTQLGLCPTLKLDVDAVVVARMEQALDEFLASGQPDAEARQRVAETEQAVWSALVTGVAAGPAPEVLRARFFDGTAAEGGLPPWRLCFLDLMRAVLKSDGKVRDAFLVSRTARLVADSARLKPVMEALHGDMRAMQVLLARVADDSAATRGNTDALLAGQARHDHQLAEILALVRTQGTIARAEAEGLAERTILELARRLRPEETHDLDSAVRAVGHAVETALDLIRRGTRPASNENAFVATVLADVARRTQAGDLDGGARAVDDGLAELDARDAEQREAMRRARATLLETAIGQEILRRDAEAVARRVEALVALDAPERPAWAPGFAARWDAFYEEGRDAGLNLSVEIAIALARRMQLTADAPDEHGRACKLLGDALTTLGQRAGDTARLEEAVAAYRAALQVWTRDRVPLDWAIAQANLATALASLGQREIGTARMEQAVQACRAALEETPRERFALGWAGMRDNLATALWTLGQRQNRTALVEEAVRIYRSALEERTRDRAPLDWAATQNNLGNALATLGQTERGTARLEEAVAAYRAALEAWTPDRVPLDWATAQTNLGNTLALIGQREADAAALAEAVAAYEAALAETTRDRAPLAWATIQNNLGNALRALGTQLDDPARLQDAVHAMRAALVERRRDRVPRDWAATQHNLGVALSALGRAEGGTRRLEQAVDAYRLALEERTRERVPLDWAKSNHSLGNALERLAQRRADRASLLAQAVAAMRRAVDGYRQAGDAYWAPIAEARLGELEALARSA